MMEQRGFWAVIVALVVAGSLVVLGDADDSVNLTAATEVWGDVVRDVDQFGLSLTRLSDAEEIRLGKRLAVELFASDAVDDPRSAYVAAVGRLLEPHLRRRQIPYTYHVVDWWNANAIALPGGQVFITTGMLDMIETEAELAAILGHEMAHIDLRHCVELFQTTTRLEKADLGAIADLVNLLPQLARMGYRKYQEVEADAAGQRLAIAAGYDPRAAVELMRRVAEREWGGLETTRTTARNPLEEVLVAAGDSLGESLASHPDPAERIARLERLEARRRFWTAARPFAIGRENYRRRVTVAAETFAGETTIE
jgi:predicted Zn-dependent protease